MDPASNEPPPADPSGDAPARPIEELKRLAGLPMEERAARLSELVDRLEKDLDATADLATDPPAEPQQ